MIETDWKYRVAKAIKINYSFGAEKEELFYAQWRVTDILMLVRVHGQAVREPFVNVSWSFPKNVQLTGGI